MVDALLSLAARCEAANGPDRDLDGEIVIAVFGWTFEKRKGDAKPYWRKAGVTEYYMREMNGPPCYTASLDAALSLVPGGLGVQLNVWPIGPDGRCQAMVGEEISQRKDRHLALVLCAAALRARARALA